MVLGEGVTFGDALSTVGKEILGSKKFKGIFSEGETPTLEPGSGCLINKPKNVHWIAQYRDLAGKLHTFDSYGRKMGPNPVPPIDGFKQHGKEMNCGPRSLAYLYDRLVESGRGGFKFPNLGRWAKAAGTVAGLYALEMLLARYLREED